MNAIQTTTKILKHILQTQRMKTASATPSKQIKLVSKGEETLVVKSQKSQMEIGTNSVCKTRISENSEEDAEVEVVEERVNSLNKPTFETQSTDSLESENVSEVPVAEERKQQGLHMKSKLWHATGMTVSELLKRKRQSLPSLQSEQTETEAGIDQLIPNVIESEKESHNMNESNESRSSECNTTEKLESNPRNKTQPERLWYQMPRTRAQRKLYVQQQFHDLKKQTGDSDNSEKRQAPRDLKNSERDNADDQTLSINSNPRKTWHSTKSKLPEQFDTYSETLSFTTEMFPDIDIDDTRIISLSNTNNKNDSLEYKSEQATKSQNNSKKDQNRCKVNRFRKSEEKNLGTNKHLLSDEVSNKRNADNVNNFSEGCDSNIQNVESDSDTQSNDLTKEYLYTLSCPQSDLGDTSAEQEFKSVKDNTSKPDNSTAIINKENDSTADIVSEMVTSGAQILYEFSQGSLSRKENSHIQNFNINEDNSDVKSLKETRVVEHSNIRKRKMKTTKAVKHKCNESEISFAQVGESAKIFIQKHPLLHGIYLNKGKREVKRRLIKLKRHKNAIDKGSYLRNGKINDKNRIDDLFEYTEEGKKKKDAIDENNARDEYVVNWYMWCPGRGNCLRKCGGYGSCVSGENIIFIKHS